MDVATKQVRREMRPGALLMAIIYPLLLSKGYVQPVQSAADTVQMVSRRAPQQDTAADRCLETVFSWAQVPQLLPGWNARLALMINCLVACAFCGSVQFGGVPSDYRMHFLIAAAGLVAPYVAADVVERAHERTTQHTTRDPSTC